jgi:hypothetical protein
MYGLPPHNDFLNGFTTYGIVISSSQDLYLHRTTQHRPRTSIHALSETQTHDPVHERSRLTSRTARPTDRLPRTARPMDRLPLFS